MFPRVYFNKTRAERLVECLKRYRRHVSNATGEPGKPVHDEFSHGADAFRYLAMCSDDLTNENGEWAKPLSINTKYIV
jgi:phage terminase large subunit